jgi:hypothetical protein
MSIYYFTAERGTFGLLTTFKSDSVADAETNYRAASLVSDTNIVNAMYPPTLVRKTLLDLERLICTAICRTEGHARRVNFRQEVDKSHGDSLPSSIGGIGAVRDVDGNYLTRRDPDNIRELRGNNRIKSLPSFTAPGYWAWDGSVFFCTMEDVAAKVEIFLPAFPVIDAFADYDAPFVTVSPVAALVPDEFELAWAIGAAGLLASKVGTFPEESSSYLELFQGLMAQQGVKLKIALDYNADE